MKNENDQFGKFTQPGEVRIVRTLPGPIERVWDYLVDPEKRARWFAGGPMEPRQGGKVELISPSNGHVGVREAPTPVEKDAYIRGTIAKVIPGEGVIVRCEGALVQGIFG